MKSTGTPVKDAAAILAGLDPVDAAITDNRGFYIHQTPNPARADFGGNMLVIATTAEGKMQVREHFKEFDTSTAEGALAWAGVLTSSEPYAVERGEGRDNRAHFLIESSLDLEWTAPYRDELVKRTGYTGRGILPDLDPVFLTRYLQWNGLRHVYYGRRVWTEHGHFCFSVVDSASDWNNQTAADNAHAYAVDHLQEELGRRQHEPEFVEARNGMYMRNPNYLRRHRPQPGLTCKWLWAALVDWWLEHEASTAQRELVTTDGALMAKNHRGVSGLHNLKEYRGLRRDWESASITWEQFQKLS